ncbi:GTP-binding protein HSR1 [Conchiformibius steedae]|uniref:GTP-binding protein HSR1 n=2 Tax=Conchiformibius steedae TaxID=153493 RepID=A0A3P2A7I1_9NEIS|nr:GTP-binding protein HSR1 [Conchiformibius steedae]
MRNDVELAYWWQKIQNKVKALPFKPVDILLVGATGVGKSSTINALLGPDVARVGHSPSPETLATQSYQVDEWLRFWDSPGLGDGVAEDAAHAKKIVDLLYKSYMHSDGTWAWVDLVLVVLDGSLRDMGTAYQLLEQVILPCIETERIMVVINQADMAMKGRYWNHEKCCPEPVLEAFLQDKAFSVQQRLWEATGIQISMPVCYSAYEHYNLVEVMKALYHFMPTGKRKLPDGGINKHSPQLSDSNPRGMGSHLAALMSIFK